MADPHRRNRRSARSHKPPNEALRESEEKYRSIFRDSRAGKLLVSPDGRFLEANRAMCEFLGYSEEELLGKDIAALTYPEDLAKTVEAVHHVFAEGKNLLGLEKRYLHKDGLPRWGEIISSVVRGPDGKPKYHLAQIVDITERKKAEEALRAAEVRYAELIDSVRAIVWRANARTFQTTFTSKHAEEILGYPVECWLGTPKFWVDHICSEDKESVISLTSSAIAEKRKHDFEYRMIASDGSIVWLRNIVNVIVENDQPAELVGVSVDITARKKAEEALARFGGRLIEAQEKERLHVARELHDDVGQLLALLAIKLQKIENELPSDSSAPLRTDVQQSVSQILEICSTVEVLSHRLHSSKLELQGLASAMKGFCQEFSEQQGVKIDFTHRDVPRDLSPEVSLCLFRILQESLRNCAKHSGSADFTVHVEGSPDHLQLTVCDSGIGFDVEQAIQKRGIGLVSMSERVALMKGILHIGSGPRGGTEVKVQLPLAKNRAVGI